MSDALEGRHEPSQQACLPGPLPARPDQPPAFMGANHPGEQDAAVTLGAVDGQVEALTAQFTQKPHVAAQKGPARFPLAPDRQDVKPIQIRMPFQHRLGARLDHGAYTRTGQAPFQGRDQRRGKQYVADVTKLDDQDAARRLHDLSRSFRYINLR